MLRKNVASQVLTFDLVDATTGAALTGATVTTKVTLDGTQSAGGGTVTELGTGQYKYVPTQAETNGASVGCSFTATNAVPVNLHCFTIGQDPAATTLDGNVTKWSGTSVAAVDTAGYPKVTIKSGTGTGEVSLSSGLVALSAAGVQSIWDALTAALTTANSIGKLLVDNINATISSRLATSGYTAPLDAAGTRSAVGLASANLDTQLSTIASYIDTEVAAILAAVDTEVAAIKTQTDKLTFNASNQVTADLRRINNTTVNGDGAATPWGP